MFGSTVIQPEINIKRLNHSNLMDLLYEFCKNKDLKWKTLIVDEDIKTSVNEGPATISYFFCEQEIPFQKSANLEDIKEAHVVQKKQFVVFSMSKDQNDVRYDELHFMPLFSDVVKSFYKNFPTETATLLLPIHQCGMYIGLDRIPGMEYLKRISYGGMLRDHSVLAEVDSINKKITIHDSQYEIHGYLYWRDVSAPSFETTYIAHKRQIGNVLCGYYVHNYIHAFLRMGNADVIDHILLDPAAIQSRDSYLLHWQSVIENVASDSSKALLETMTVISQPLEINEEWELIERIYITDLPQESKTPISEILVGDKEWELVPNIYATEQRRLLK